MERSAVYIGLDYHQGGVQACVVDERGEVVANGRCENDWRAIREWCERRGAVRRVAIEACTGAADLADELVSGAGWSVELAHPGYVKRMKGNPDKTDYTDARMLADLTRVGYLPKVWLAPEAIRELRRLVRYRQQLVNERRSLKLRVRGLLRDHRVRDMPGGAWSKRWMQWLVDCDDLGGRAGGSSTGTWRVWGV